MKLAYVTALFPYAPEEQFFEPEVRELARALEIVVVPARPPSTVMHYSDLGAATLHMRLLSPKVIALAFREAGRAPRRALATFAALIFSQASARARLVNLIAFPKGLAVAHELRRLGVDHIHAAWLTTPATIAYIASRMTGIPYSITAHQHDIFAQNLTAEKARSARFIRAISGRNCRHLREQLEPVLAARCTVGHLGVDLPEQAPQPPARTPRILCAARLCAWKGHRFLLQALALLRDRGVDFTCDLAGDGELRQEIAASIATLGLGDRVRMLGNVPHAQLTASLASGAYDLFALASTERGGEHEGIPVAAMEAMAAGLPVVATRTGSFDELVDDASGKLVAQCDPCELAAALEAFLTDPAARAVAGRHARSRVVAEFETEATTRRLLGLLGLRPEITAALPGALR
jgi:colanic acid/amylovoran biosynthesis glycosyltransferase